MTAIPLHRVPVGATCRDARGTTYTSFGRPAEGSKLVTVQTSMGRSMTLPESTQVTVVDAPDHEARRRWALVEAAVAKRAGLAEALQGLTKVELDRVAATWQSAAVVRALHGETQRRAGVTAGAAPVEDLGRCRICAAQVRVLDGIAQAHTFGGRVCTGAGALADPGPIELRSVEDIIAVWPRLSTEQRIDAIREVATTADVALLAPLPAGAAVAREIGRHTAAIEKLERIAAAGDDEAALAELCSAQTRSQLVLRVALGVRFRDLIENAEARLEQVREARERTEIAEALRRISDTTPVLVADLSEQLRAAVLDVEPGCVEVTAGLEYAVQRLTGEVRESRQASRHDQVTPFVAAVADAYERRGMRRRTILEQLAVARNRVTPRVPPPDPAPEAPGSPVDAPDDRGGVETRAEAPERAPAPEAADTEPLPPEPEHPLPGWVYMLVPLPDRQEDVYGRPGGGAAVRLGNAEDRCLTGIARGLRAHALQEQQRAQQAHAQALAQLGPALARVRDLARLAGFEINIELNTVKP